MGEKCAINLLRALGYLKALWQILHTSGFSLLWINMCCVRACFAEKPLLHVGQIWGLSTVRS